MSQLLKSNFFIYLIATILLKKFFNFISNVFYYYNVKNYQNITVIITYSKSVVNHI